MILLAVYDYSGQIARPLDVIRCLSAVGCDTIPSLLTAKASIAAVRKMGTVAPSARLVGVSFVVLIAVLGRVAQMSNVYTESQLSSVRRNRG